MMKGVTQTHLESIWNHSEPSEVTYSQICLFHKPVTDRELFLEERYAEAALEEKQANLKFYKSMITTNLIHTTPSPCSWAKTTEVVSLALVPNRRSGSNKTSTILSEKPVRKKRSRKKNHFSSMSN